mmetsp:Transcript_22792/g.44255  ORF Transcript_22792/g.44255 Transcript_22792/m.44255 type:complete len:344 (+) Transcript_22792:257-1288(+)
MVPGAAGFGMRAWPVLQQQDALGSPTFHSDMEGDDAERRVAALLLREARNRAELAAEEGSTAFVADLRRAPRVDGRVLLAETAQVRSHNRRCGVDAAALPPADYGTVASDAERLAGSLDREFFKRERELRGATTASTVGVPPKRRQRVGAGPTALLDVAAAGEAEARLADEDVLLANPLLRPPPALESAKKRRCSNGNSLVTTGNLGRNEAELVENFWPSRKLRVRVVDEVGAFREAHLRKGIVCHVNSVSATVDLELEAAGVSNATKDNSGDQMLRGVPLECLETVVSKLCRRVEIVRGPHRNLVAELLGRDTVKNEAVVRLSRGHGEAELRLRLDDVCEFA